MIISAGGLNWGRGKKKKKASISPRARGKVVTGQRPGEPIHTGMAKKNKGTNAVRREIQCKKKRVGMVQDAMGVGTGNSLVGIRR